MDTFNKNGSYNKTIWNLGDKITSDKLNKIEAAIYQINDTYATEEYVDNIAFGGDVDKFITKEELEAKEYLTEHQDISHLASKEELPTNVSELANDAGYLTEHQSLDGLATETYVNDAIGNIDAILDAINGEEI